MSIIPSEPDAVAILRAELIARFETAPAHAAGPILFSAFRDELIALYQPPLRAKATMVKMRQTLDIVAELIGPAGTTAELTPTLVARYIASRPPRESPNTTVGMLRTLRTVCSFAAAQGYCRVSPFSLRKQWVRSAPANRERQKHHSAEDIGRVLELMRQDTVTKMPGSWSAWRARRLYALACTVAYTGMRKNEALRLRLEDLDIPNRMIIVVAREGNRLKTVSSAAPVPIPDRLAEILAAWLPYQAIGDRPAVNPTGPSPASNPEGTKDASWLFTNSFQTGPWTGGSKGYRPLDRMKRLGERAGVEGFTFLSLRHSFASHAESLWGMSEAMIQRILRHTSPATQKFYRHADVPNLKAAVKGIGFGTERPDPTAAAAPAAAPIVPFVFEPPAPPRPPVKAPRQSARKLDDDDVSEMRELRARGWSYTALMQRYNVRSKSTLHAAIHGFTHKAVGLIDDGSKGV